MRKLKNPRPDLAPRCSGHVVILETVVSSGAIDELAAHTATSKDLHPLAAPAVQYVPQCQGSARDVETVRGTDPFHFGRLDVQLS